VRLSRSRSGLKRTNETDTVTLPGDWPDRIRTSPCDDKEASADASVAQLQHTYENGLAARANEWRANPFEDPYGADWPGRREYAAAWNRGRDEWEVMHEIRAAGGPDQEVGLAASREVRNHRRRMLEHQEQVEAAQHSQAEQPSDPQLKIRLIGEVRRPEPAPPKRRRSRKSKSIQPKLTETD